MLGFVIERRGERDEGNLTTFEDRLGHERILPAASACSSPDPRYKTPRREIGRSGRRRLVRAGTKAVELLAVERVPLPSHRQSVIHTSPGAIGSAGDRNPLGDLFELVATDS
jgi:hypothetical protein